MPLLFEPTSTPCAATLGAATLNGRVWTAKPPYVSPNDATPQAAVYRAMTASSSLSCKVWLGVRAASYTRFKPAAPFTYAAGAYNCTVQPTVPHQTYFEELGSDGRPGLYGTTVGTYDWPGIGTVESEDAGGVVNIFAPATPGPHPVLFHIHGGGWGVYHALAAQQWAAFYAAYFNVVVVLPEYRLSTFGHFPHPDLIEDGEPSVAYTDLKECLRFVNASIDEFDGDAARVMASGTSAGGAAVLLLQEDDEAVAWLSAAHCDSGGGSAPYLTDAFYGPRVDNFERSVRLMARILTSAHADYRTVQDAFDDGRDIEWVWQNALRPEHVQAMADIGPTVTATSVRSVLDGIGDLVPSRRNEPENFYPYRRGVYASGIAAARAGKIRAPTIFSYAECEALNLLGSDYTSIRDTLRALPTATLDGWAQRLGFATYAAWKASDWITTLASGDLQNFSSAQFKTSIDTLAADCENRRVLYTHAVFGYPAWRMARATVENGGDAWLVVNNFSANSIWAGHSQMVPLVMGTVEWNVGGVQNFPSATPPGDYANVRMDIIYAALGIVGPMIARMAATGDPNGAYTFPASALLSGNPPADGGSLAGTWQPYSLAQPGHHNVLGKYFDPDDNQNAGTFFAGTGVLDLASQRDARTTYAEYMQTAYLEYLALLEP